LGEQWLVSGNWTHNDAEDTSNEQRLRRPRNLGNVSLQYRSPSQQLRFIASYRLSRDSIDVGGVALDDYGVLDLSVAYDVSSAVEVYGRLENATDEEYEEVIGHDSAGRAAYAGVRVRFEPGGAPRPASPRPRRRARPPRARRRRGRRRAAARRAGETPARARLPSAGRARGSRRPSRRM